LSYTRLELGFSRIKVGCSSLLISKLVVSCGCKFYCHEGISSHEVHSRQIRGGILHGCRWSMPEDPVTNYSLYCRSPMEVHTSDGVRSFGLSTLLHSLWVLIHIHVLLFTKQMYLLYISSDKFWR
jgi:hypothetical protein